MKQLLLAMATLAGMSSASLAAEPVALTDSQLDNVTAGAISPAWLLIPAVGAFGIPLAPALPPPLGGVAGALPGLPTVP
jgi:hypothetical protein